MRREEVNSEQDDRKSETEDSGEEVRSIHIDEIINMEKNQFQQVLLELAKGNFQLLGTGTMPPYVVHNRIIIDTIQMQIIIGFVLKSVSTSLMKRLD